MMLKFVHVLLTIALSIYTLGFKSSGVSLPLDENSPVKNQEHQLKDNSTYNTCAIEVDNAFEELIDLDEHEKIQDVNHFYTNPILNEIDFKPHLNYLKTCSLFNLNLSISKIIFPFHSFF